MKKLSCFFCICVLLFLFCNNAWSNFYVIAGGGTKVGTEIKSLPYTISETGFYYITKDLISKPNNFGIVIASHDVTLDLMGHMITSLSSTGDYRGIYTNYSNVEIRNGTVKGFPSNGIANGATSTGIRIINVRVVNNGLNGIYLEGEGAFVTDCTAKGNGDSGISLRGDSCIVKDCISFSNTYTGIRCDAGSTITGSISHDNGTNGINAASGSTITGNTSYDNDEFGIDAGFGSVIKGNTCRSNGGDGIWTNDGCTIIENACYINSDDGIDPGEGSSIIGNTCYKNTGCGIELGGNSYVAQNTCYGNAINMTTCPTCTGVTDNHSPF